MGPDQFDFQQSFMGPDPISLSSDLVVLVTTKNDAAPMTYEGARVLEH